MDARIPSVLRATWGFETLRPLQHEAVVAALAGRDALVVLPTGGGKSLCYQLPPLLRNDRSLCIVVSPLIALMKDQVDGLRLVGYPAAALHSGVSVEESVEVRRGVQSGAVKLLYVSPERLLSEGFLGWIAAVGRVASVAIDEAHCISQWGHDFRPEYRRLAELREALPGVPIQAYTATATPRVREDIQAQLRMVEPAVLVGRFDRPNLAYRVLPRVGDGEDQVEAILRRHQGEAAIVYCISRKQTESLASALAARGLSAEAYHAGLDPKRRSAVQERFLGEALDIVVATVAFGMGIDRGDVRAVIHASMPKSVEAYQQETGRAGRDGLPAECVLLYSSADVVRWGQLIDRSAAESDVDVPPEVLRAQKGLLAQIQRLAASGRCRHEALSAYFGQEYVPPEGPADGPGGCGACDVCLGELEEVPDATLTARKILSCVARLRGPGNHAFGAAYVADVLRGSAQAKINDRGHDRLSTFGLLPDLRKDELVGLIHQLVDVGALDRDGGEYPVVRLGPRAGPILRGEVPVRLVRARASEEVAATERKRRRVDVTGTEAAALSPAETRLFDALRRLRREIATGLGVPPFIVFGDAPLIEMALTRPGSLASFANVRGVGQVKIAEFGTRFVETIRAQCAVDGLALDARPGSRPRPLPSASSTPAAPRPPNETRRVAFGLFRQGLSIVAVAARTDRAPSTTLQMLVEYIEQERPASIAPWVDDALYARVIQAMAVVSGARLRPVFDYLAGEVPYEVIRIVQAHQRAHG